MTPGRIAAQAPAPAGDEFLVNTYTAGGQRYGAVASDPAGSFVVVWQSADQDGDGNGIFGQRFDPSGSTQGGEFQVNTYTADQQLYPAVSADDLGNFVVVWTSALQDGSLDGIFGRRFDALGAPLSADFQVNSYTTSTQIAPSVAHDGAGNFTVVWSGAGSGDSVGVFGRRFDALGSPLGDEFLVNSYTTGHQLFGSVSSDDAGNFVVVWTNYGFPDTFGISGQRFDASGLPVGGEFQVNTSTATPRYPAVSMNDGGRFVVVWEEPLAAGGRSVFARRYESDGSTLGAPFQLDAHLPAAQRAPSVAADDSGGFVAVWTDGSRDGDASGVFGRAFDAAGDPLGDDFQIHQHTADAQALGSLGPPLAMDAAGNFVATWTSAGQDGDGDGVFARRFLAGPGLGGTVTGVLPRRLTCRNITTTQQVSTLIAATEWNCTALGLGGAPGERAAMILLAHADGVQPISGTVTGLAIPPNLRVRCENLTTATTVQFVRGVPSWDCTAMGFVAGPNDRLRLTLVGTFE